ncbi:hypothetical protein [Cupriavidus plantarum]|uniref:hypothetical protein n=1 Tax=Cupriavidus plantarum TaxID=942865 RepID=UPI00339D4E8E
MEQVDSKTRGARGWTPQEAELTFRCVDGVAEIAFVSESRPVIFPDAYGTMRTLKEKLQSFNNWLMTPVIFATRWRRFILLKMIRSRLFLIAALLTSVADLTYALGATWKASHPSPDVRAWLLWILAGITWAYFAVVVFYAYRSARRGQIFSKD